MHTAPKINLVTKSLTGGNINGCGVQLPVNGASTPEAGRVYFSK